MKSVKTKMHKNKNIYFISQIQQDNSSDSSRCARSGKSLKQTETMVKVLVWGRIPAARGDPSLPDVAVVEGSGRHVVAGGLAVVFFSSQSRQKGSTTRSWAGRSVSLVLDENRIRLFAICIIDADPIDKSMMIYH